MENLATAKAFLEANLPHLCRNTGADLDTAQQLFFEALQVNAEQLSHSINLGFMPEVPESRKLWDFLANLLVDSNSQLVNSQHFQTALDFMSQGGNVLVLQNHTSGADTIIFDCLLNRKFPGNPGRNIAYMAGHVVNVFLIPLTICAAIKRFQIYSSRYQGIAEEIGINAKDMKAQNTRALNALTKYVQPGGKMIGLYPEGGRGEGQLKLGDPQTAVIPSLMSKYSPQGLMILASFVQGATDILPVRRTENEFDHFMEWIKCGTANISFGKPVMWLKPPINEIETICTATDCCDRVGANRLAHKQNMTMLAQLAPTEYAKGPWANPEAIEWPS